MSYRTSEVTRLRHNRVYLAAGGFPLLLALVFLVASLLTGMIPLTIPIPHALILGGLGLTWAYGNNRNPVRVLGELVVDDDALWFGGKKMARRSEISGAFVQPDEDGTRVYVRLKGVKVPLLFSATKEKPLRDLVRALGFDATQTAVEMRAASDVMAWSTGKQLLAFLGPVFGAFVPGLMGIAFAQPRHGGVYAIVTVAAMMTFIFGLLLAPTRVKIGVDGLAIRWLHKHRFISFAEIADVDTYRLERGTKVHVGIALDLTSGERVLIPQGQEGFLPVHRTAMLQRIRDARAVWTSGSPTLDPGLLARGNLSYADWVQRLRRLAAGAGVDHRTAPLSEAQVRNLLGDASAKPAMRAAAAVVLLESQDPDAQARVRIAAETTASPALRLALNRALDAESEQEALEEALAWLEAEPALIERAE